MRETEGGWQLNWELESQESLESSPSLHLCCTICQENTPWQIPVAGSFFFSFLFFMLSFYFFRNAFRFIAKLRDGKKITHTPSVNTCSFSHYQHPLPDVHLLWWTYKTHHWKSSNLHYSSLSVLYILWVWWLVLSFFGFISNVISLNWSVYQWMSGKTKYG